MIEKLFDINKELNELRFRRNVFEALLVSSRDESNSYLPAIEEFILSEVVNGIIAYIGGNSGELQYRRGGDGENNFERVIVDYFSRELSTVPKKLDVDIASAVVELVKPKLQHEPRECSYWDTEVYAHFKGDWGCGICPVMMQSTFSLPQETVYRVKNKILPALSDLQRRDIAGIGISMMPFIAEDLKFIHKNYHW